MGRVHRPLRQMGADIRAREDNFAPLEIHGTSFRGIHYKMPMASAQGEVRRAAGGIIRGRHDVR